MSTRYIATLAPLFLPTQQNMWMTYRLFFRKRRFLIGLSVVAVLLIYLGYLAGMRECFKVSSSVVVDEYVIKSVPLTTAVNTTWTLLRKKLLNDNHRVTRVLILGYMRGGTTLFYRIFNDSSPAHVTWFEPLDSFYSSYFGLASPNIPLPVLYHTNLTRRLPSSNEQSELTDHLSRMLTNDVDSLPLDLLSSVFLQHSNALRPIEECIRMKTKGWTLYNCTAELVNICGLHIFRPNVSISMERRCPQIIKALNLLNPSGNDDLEKVKLAVESLVRWEVRDTKTFLDHHHCLKRMDTLIRSCWTEAKPRLNKATMVVAKLIRWSFVDLEALIQQMPDLHLIHYVRDPRPTSSSRKETDPDLSWHDANWTVFNEAQALCARMRDDIAAKQVIEEKYPGALLTVRYEDFVSYIPQTIEQVFSYIGRATPVGTCDRMIYFSVRRWKGVRMHAAKVLDRWKSLVSYEEAGLMNGYCRDVLKHFKYTL